MTQRTAWKLLEAALQTSPSSLPDRGELSPLYMAYTHSGSSARLLVTDLRSLYAAAVPPSALDWQNAKGVSARRDADTLVLEADDEQLFLPKAPQGEFNTCFIEPLAISDMVKSAALEQALRIIKAKDMVIEALSDRLEDSGIPYTPKRFSRAMEPVDEPSLMQDSLAAFDRMPPRVSLLNLPADAMARAAASAVSHGLVPRPVAEPDDSYDSSDDTTTGPPASPTPAHGEESVLERRHRLRELLSHQASPAKKRRQI